MLVRLSGTQIAAPAANNKVVTSGAGASASITVAAVDDKRHILHKLVWSYSAAPTGGGISVTGGTNTLDIDVTNAGPGSLSINYVCLAETDLVVTIDGGGGAVVGKLYIEHILEP